MTAVLALYLLALGLWGSELPARLRRRRAAARPAFALSFDEFAVAGRRQSARAVALSLMATALGASTTLGMADLAARRGPVAFLWLGAGAAGLWLQAAFFARAVRDSRARTLPEIAGQWAGRAGRRLLAGVIVLSWIGVVAAQFVGLGAVLAGLFPDLAAGHGLDPWIWFAGLAVAAYSALGGQRAVIRTDGVQALWLFAAIGLVLGWLCLGGVPGAKPPAWTPLAVGDWSVWDTLRVTVLVGGAYVVGPDLFSRHGSARDGHAARRAAFWAGGGLVVAGLAVTAVGLWTRANGVPATADGAAAATPFVYLLGGVLPGWLTAVLALGLAGALLSSADTCLVGVATMIEVDLLGRERAGRARLWVLVVGGLALLAATRGTGILAWLLRAYSVYVPGVAAPVAVALWGRRRGRTPRAGRWLAAVAAGGVLGLAGEAAGLFDWLPDPWARPGLALLGVASSSLLAARSLATRQC